MCCIYTIAFFQYSFASLCYCCTFTLVHEDYFLRKIVISSNILLQKFYVLKIIDQNFESSYIYSNGTSTLYKNVVVDEVVGGSFVEYVNYLPIEKFELLYAFSFKFLYEVWQ